MNLFVFRLGVYASDALRLTPRLAEGKRLEARLRYFKILLGGLHSTAKWHWW